MGRKANNRRPQNLKDRAAIRERMQSDSRRITDGPVPSKPRYSRATVRNNAQRGIYGEDD